ncbi:MAG: trypsin-like peptidase domain-containing protein [Lachnospiraceae bacterium]|nr:trypsin-like peptidase domain-containing protein [Lachnospiraceae bacterium]
MKNLTAKIHKALCGRFLARVLAVMVCAVLIATVFTPAAGAYAAETASAEARLSTRNTKIWVNGKTTVSFTLTDRTADETLTVTPEDSSLVKTKVGKWKGDRVNVAFTPKKTATTTVTVSCGGESIKLTLVMRKQKAMTSEEAYTYAYGACVEIKTWDSNGQPYIGSGFFVGPGEVLTAQHVVAAASKLTVTGYDGTKYTVKSIIACSEKDDLVLIKTAEKNKAALSIADEIRGGMKMYSFGSPAGVTASFCEGIVANPMVLMNDEEIPCFQSTMPSGIGSGGGPMIDENGRVIGLMAFTVTTAQNLNFGIRYDVIKKFLDGITPDQAMSMKAFYKANAGKTKESNDYGIFEKGSNAVANTAFGKAFTELTPEEAYAQAHDAMVDIFVFFDDGNAASGSGFFIDEETVVTCAHVISHGNILLLKVTDYNGNLYAVSKDYRINEDYDVAILTVELKDGKGGHTSLNMAPGYLPAGGERVYAFGSPAGYTCTFSDGITIISDARLAEDECAGLGVATDLNFIIFSAPISTGSSGGVLMNKYGQAIAITSGVINVTENLNLAIQIDQISKAK